MPARRKYTGVSLVILAMLLFTIWLGWTAIKRSVPIDQSNRMATARLPDMRININMASAAELSQLPGLGPKLAQRIVDDREQRGEFETIDDIQRVTGIGPAIAERIRPFVVLE